MQLQHVVRQRTRSGGVDEVCEPNTRLLESLHREWPRDVEVQFGK